MDRERMNHSPMFVAALVALIFGCAPAHAQAQAAVAAGSAAQPEVTSYPPSFFAQYNPVTAWDMINRIPGFDVDWGSSGRGLAGSAGNVLVDGERPPGKTDLGDMLDRLRAGDVARIDLIRGGAPGIDMQGKQTVINIIRLAPSGGFSSITEVGVRHRPGVDRIDATVDLDGTWESEKGNKFQGELSYDRSKGDSPPGGSRVRTTPDGVLISSTVDQSRGEDEDISGAASAEFGLLGGQARLTGTAESSRDSERETEVVYAGAPRLTESSGSGKRAELEASYAYSLSNGGTLQAVVSQRRDEDKSASVSLSGRPPTARRSTQSGGEIGVTGSYPLGGYTRLQAIFAKSWNEESSTSSSLRSDGTLSNEIDSRDVGETALRTSLFLDPRDVLSIEAGAEAAYNFLEGSSEIALDGAVIQIPGSRAKVEEERGEAFLVATWRARPDLAIEGALRYEFSTLATTRARKDLKFLKPRLQARWNLGGGREVVARIERRVGQLNFGDFLSSAAISEYDEIITAGAVDLTPTQDWVSSVRFDQRFWESGALAVEVEYHAQNDLIDNRPVVTPSGSFEGRGNIGQGQQAYLDIELDAPLDQLGVEGGRLILDGRLLLLSRMTDPFTGEERAFAWDRDYDVNFSYEQDVRDLDVTWGLSLGTQAERFSYRRNSIEVSRQSPYFSAFATYQPDANSTFRLELDNVVPRRFDNRRQVYLGRRDIAPLDFIETRLDRDITSLRLTYRRVTD